MMPLYQCRHFILQEFLPPKVFNELLAANALWKGWMLIDERMLRTADQLRDAFGVLTINNWHKPQGDRSQSGLRVPGMPTFKIASQHSYGRALDLISPTLSGEDMRKHILAHPEKFPFICRMERGVAWLHVDVGNATPITLVDP